MSNEIYKDQNMTKFPYDEKCPYCGGTGFETVQAFELAKIDPVKYKDIIEEHIRLYNSIDAQSQDYTIPCRRCNGGHVQKVEFVRERANIPSSFYDKHIEDFDTNIYMDSDGKTVDISEKMNVINSFITDFPKWEKEGLGLYICSSMKGSGKTFLASCICNSLIDKYPINTKFVSASNLLELSRQSDGSGNYSRDPISLLRNCKILVLDDLGQKNNGSDWLNDILFQIVDKRYQQKLVTIYTSNVKMSNLDLDDRIVDRINRTTIQMELPEYCVRAKEANQKKIEFLKSIGI